MSNWSVKYNFFDVIVPVAAMLTVVVAVAIG